MEIAIGIALVTTFLAIVSLRRGQPAGAAIFALIATAAVVSLKYAVLTSIGVAISVGLLLVAYASYKKDDVASIVFYVALSVLSAWVTWTNM